MSFMLFKWYIFCMERQQIFGLVNKVRGPIVGTSKSESSYNHIGFGLIQLWSYCRIILGLVSSNYDQSVGSFGFGLIQLAIANHA